jgi:hypothetical protein
LPNEVRAEGFEVASGKKILISKLELASEIKILSARLKIITMTISGARYRSLKI